MGSVHKITKTKSARFHKAISNQIEEYARKTGRDDSEIIKEAVGYYLKVNDDIETPEPVNKVLEDLELYKQADAQDYFIRKENERASIKLKELTFTEYMYKNAASVFMANRTHLEDDALKEHIRESLEVLKRRAEHHDKLDAWNELYDNPLAEIKDYLERKSVEDKAFGDWIDQMDY